jgi:hypothetical protein
VDVLANTVAGMKTKQNALANTLGHPPIEEGLNPTDTEASRAGTPT